MSRSRSRAKTWFSLFLFLVTFVALPLNGTFAKSPLKSGYSNADCPTLFAQFAKQTPEGPRFFSKAPTENIRKPEEITSLTSMQYNVENLFNYQGKYGYDEQGMWTQLKPPLTKPEARFLRLKDNIERANPDIMTWQEVENFQAAEDFVNTYLGGKYRVILIEGNDGRGIDVAILVKKDLPFDVISQSHREVAKEGQKLFSRDFVVSEFHLAGAKDGDEPLFKIMNTHNKSQRDSPGDPGSVKKRLTQIQEQAKILLAEEKKHPDVPAFVVGDMNADIRSASEFQPLWDIGYKDSFDLVSSPIPLEMRVTQSFFPESGPTKHNQLDGILASKKAQDAGIVQQMEIVNDLDANGNPLPLPQSFQDREKQASDHRAILMHFDFQKIFGSWKSRK